MYGGVWSWYILAYRENAGLERSVGLGHVCASSNYYQTCIVHLHVYLYLHSCFSSLTTYHTLA